MQIGDITLDQTLVFALAFALIALAVAGGAIGFALWYTSDQDQL